jgi:hypothetical protein
MVSASKGKGLMIAGVVIALLVAVGLAIAFSRGGERAKEPPPPPARDSGRAPAPTLAAAPPPTTAFSAPPAPSPIPVASPTPSPRPSLAPSPMLSISPFPSARPTPGPTPAETEGPPEETEPAGPVIVHPDVESSPSPPVEDPRGRGPAAVPVAGDVTGQWDLSNRVVSTDYEGFRGLNLGYRLTLRQNGSRITGSGIKVSENGAPSNRTPITVSGRIEGSNVVLTFTEQGATRSSGGTFRWQLSADGSSLRGSFWSDAANTNGPSSARRSQ